MAYRALVPVKALSTVKSRLAPHLSLCQRETLVLDMLHHVLAVLQESERLEQIAVVSPDERVLHFARKWGARALLEEQPGHNVALHSAALEERGATGLLTISADLPLLQADDIFMLIEQAAQYDVVLAPSRDETGTNALLVRPPLALPYLFGPNSLQRYLQAARQEDLSSTVYKSRGLALDIDTIDDLHILQMIREKRNHERQQHICCSVLKEGDVLCP